MRISPFQASIASLFMATAMSTAPDTASAQSSNAIQCPKGVSLLQCMAASENRNLTRDQQQQHVNEIARNGTSTSRSNQLYSTYDPNWHYESESPENNPQLADSQRECDRYNDPQANARINRGIDRALGINTNGRLGGNRRTGQATANSMANCTQYPDQVREEIGRNTVRGYINGREVSPR